MDLDVELEARTPGDVRRISPEILLSDLVRLDLVGAERNSLWKTTFRRSGHVVAYGIATLAGYFASVDVLVYFNDLSTSDSPGNGNALGGIVTAIARWIGVWFVGLVAIVFVFVAIVGVGGGVMSQAWSRLAPMVLDRRSTDREVD